MLTRKQARREIKAAARLAVGPEQRIVKAERRTSKVQSQRIEDWFGQYQDAVDKAAGRTASAYERAYTELGGIGGQNPSSGANAAAQKADEATRGVAHDSATGNLSSAAQNARAASLANLRGVTSSQGASQAAYLHDKSRIGNREMVEQLLREQARRRSYGQDLKDLARRRGDAQVAERSRLRESERDYKLGLMAAKGSKRGQRLSAQASKRSARTSRQNSKRSAATTQRGQDITRENSLRSAATTRRGQNISRQNSRRSAAGGAGDRRGPPGSKEDRQRARAYVYAGRAKETPRETYLRLVNRGVDPAVARYVIRSIRKKATGAAANVAKGAKKLGR